jgi:MoaA/NifB/PqqE/SkfB family radical SAM enzyme
VNVNHCFNCWRAQDAYVYLESLAHVDVENLVYSVFYRILQLSTANKTFSFCSGNQCPKIGDKDNLAEDGQTVSREKFELLKPQEYLWSINYDSSCNLKCITCRKDYKTKPEPYWEEFSDMVHQTVIENIKLMPRFIIGEGEMLFSKYYQEIIFDKNPNKSIEILTNGILFNEQNWQKLRNKYDKVSVNVSVDAASKETYKYVRNGNFDVLLKNLRMISELRKTGEIEHFVINFTIGVFNFREIKDFVKLGKELSCDIIDLHKVRYFGIWNTDSLYTADVYDERNPHHKEFLEIISDPIFRSPDVSVSDKRGIEHLFEEKPQGEVGQCPIVS